ncbi:MAG: excisionase family DNA-binding protein [Eubacterium sp.]|nr:excisionase family DNA-binding protein [Eubacterium sp.]MBR2278359.1 excisionase family DNA-binding protein [Eubacterium sp.]
MDKNFITVAEIAADLGVNKNYVYDLIELGYIKSFKIGRNFRIKMSSYEEFLTYTDSNDLPSYEQARFAAERIRKRRSKAS